MISAPDPQINPFSSRFTNPVACEFVPRSDHCLVPECADRFTSANAFGQIVGPHGSGKTTLAIAIARQLSGRFGRCALVTIGKESTRPYWQSAGIRHSQWLAESAPSGNNHVVNPTLILLDGAGLLSPVIRWLMLEHFRRNRLAVLMTSHRAFWGVPMVARLQSSRDHFQQIVESLCPQGSMPFTPQKLSEIHRRNRGDYRLGLRDCYDQFPLRCK